MEYARHMLLNEPVWEAYPCCVFCTGQICTKRQFGRCIHTWETTNGSSTSYNRVRECTVFMRGTFDKWQHSNKSDKLQIVSQQKAFDCSSCTPPPFQNKKYTFLSFEKIISFLLKRKMLPQWAVVTMFETFCFLIKPTLYVCFEGLILKEVDRPQEFTAFFLSEQPTPRSQCLTCIQYKPTISKGQGGGTHFSGKGGFPLPPWPHPVWPPSPGDESSLLRSSILSIEAKPPRWLKHSWSLVPPPDNVLLISPRDRSIWFSKVLSHVFPRWELLDNLSTCLLKSLSAFCSL